MSEPQHPSARDPFDKSAAEIEAWRQQQIAALTDKQREAYEQACRNTGEDQKRKAQKLASCRHLEIKEKMLRKLLEAPELELNYDGRKVRLNEATARNLIEKHFRPNQPEDQTVLGRMVQDAARAAIRDIDHQHRCSIEATKQEGRQKLDYVLHAFERARELRPDLRQEFARASDRDKARTDFKEAVTGRGLEAVKSEAIARAIEKVRQKEQQEIARGNRDTGRERLTDTFNKTR
ncbi:MAG: hypothetical protein H6843_08875 [Rhodospirillaceae bacterium]|nr:hypothetical protein [Rhodospirillaceae bacterium]